MITPFIQREAVSEEEEEDPIMTKVLSSGRSQATDSLLARLNRSKDGGQKLPETDRGYMERRFGIDFSNVRVHADGNASQMNKELNAMAFTHGRDIYFGAGRYNPGTESGKKLVAHELAHEAMHWEDRGPLTRSIAELEAESVAYVVCRHFGLDVEVRSSRYIALWQGDAKALRGSLERIAKTARDIIDDAENSAKASVAA